MYSPLSTYIHNSTKVPYFLTYVPTYIVPTYIVTTVQIDPGRQLIYTWVSKFPWMDEGLG
jgi:hypothetical protein